MSLDREQAEEILTWGGDDDPGYWGEVEFEARRLGTDGCSGPVVQCYVRACWEHDVHYRTHEDLIGFPISKETADYVFRRRIQAASALGALSPMSWWRWAALRLFGRRAWEQAGEGSPVAG